MLRSFLSAWILLSAIFISQVQGQDNDDLFATLDDVFEPASLTVLLGSCQFDENVEWTKKDEINLKHAILNQLDSMCSKDEEHGHCGRNLSRVRILFDSSSTKQQRMFWRTKLTMIYPENPYSNVHEHSDEPIFDKELLSDVLDRLSQNPNGSIPGWSILDHERPFRVDPFQEMINLYVLPIGGAVAAAIMLVAWLGIKIRQVTLTHEMEIMREYKAWKRQRDFLRRQHDSRMSNYPLVRKHVYPYIALNAERMFDAEKSKSSNKHRGATSALCASVASTALKLTAGTLEFDHDLRVNVDDDEYCGGSATASPFASISSRKGAGRFSRPPNPDAARRRTPSTGNGGGQPKEKTVTFRTHFVLTPLRKQAKGNTSDQQNATRL